MLLLLLYYDSDSDGDDDDDDDDDDNEVVHHIPRQIHTQAGLSAYQRMPTLDWCPPC